MINAVDHGKEMTATNAGIVGADKLNNDIKFLWNYAGNCITNQHGDINYTHDVLADESKLEFILVWDTVMTDSAKYADILLPDAMRSEQLNMQTQATPNTTPPSSWAGPRRKRRASAAPATTYAPTSRQVRQEGRVHRGQDAGRLDQGALRGRRESRRQHAHLGRDQGPRRVQASAGAGHRPGGLPHRPGEEPAVHAVGKIEIYSEQLAEIAATWELEEGDVINPIPVFTPGFQATAR
mgnify:CR=1 FL=1